MTCVKQGGFNLLEHKTTERILLDELLNIKYYKNQVIPWKKNIKIIKNTYKNLEKTENYTGTVSRVNGNIDATTQTITVFIEVKHPDLKLITEIIRLAFSSHLKS